MGEARRRGTFEERKAQAIRAGRIKIERVTKPKYYSGFWGGANLLDLDPTAALIALAAMSSTIRRTRR